MNIIKLILIRQIKSMINEALTAENVKRAFNKVIEYLATLTATTGTKIDDYLLEALKTLAANDDSVRTLVEFVRGLVATTDANGNLIVGGCGVKPDISKVCNSELLQGIIDPLAAWATLDAKEE